MFTVYGKGFDSCLVNLEQVLQRSVEKDLVLNYEKMEGIVLRHVVSGRGIEVDKAKVDIISTLPYPNSIK